jgi:hypothetical protein
MGTNSSLLKKPAPAILTIMHGEFKTRWLDRFGLPSPHWQEKARAHVNNLPFADPVVLEDLLRALFENTPEFLMDHQDDTSLLIAEAFGWSCFSIWQCGSAFPSFPENYALFLKDALFGDQKKRTPEAELLSRMLVEFNTQQGQCGFNKLALSNPQAIRESEERIHEGNYEFYLKAREKYDEFQFYLKESQAFKAEWQSIKSSFPKQTKAKEIVHRTLLAERNWEQGPGALFKTKAQRFQATFDLFCWKYYLWGMKGDEPLLMKPSVVFTPLGTQIFIPGYLSLDAKRDLNFSAINQIHKARGVMRQGEGFSVGRHARAEQKKKAKSLDKKAQEIGLKGDARYRFIARELGMPDRGDYRNVRSLLKTD